MTIISDITKVIPRIKPKIIENIHSMSTHNRVNRDTVLMYASAANFGLSALMMAITAYYKDKVSPSEKKFALIQGCAEALVNVSFAILLALGLKKGINCAFLKGKILPTEVNLKKVIPFAEKFEELIKKGYKPEEIVATLSKNERIRKLHLPKEEQQQQFLEKLIKDHFKLDDIAPLKDALSKYHSAINQFCSSILGAIIAFNVFAIIVKNKITHLFVKKNDNPPTKTPTSMKCTVPASETNTNNLTQASFGSNLEKTSPKLNENITTEKIDNKTLYFLSKSQNNEIKNTYSKFMNNPFSNKNF